MRDQAGITVVGGGLAGGAFALAAGASRGTVSVVEGRTPAAVSGWDARVYAISPANQRFLEALGVWQRLDPDRIAPVRRMEIHGDGNGRLDFSSYECGASELAWIVEGGRLHGEIWAALEGQPHVRVICPAKPVHLDPEGPLATLELSDGSLVCAPLMVGADGVDSWTREAAGIPARVNDYGELGVVANLACERPHRDTAYQWFRADGVLALLPLPGKRVSVVWSTPTANGESLLAESQASFCERIREASADRLGRLEAITPPRGFPLRLMRPERIIDRRVALIGDAAHAIHPLSGHGINLGFQDACILARTLIAAGPNEDVGHRSVLRRYERARVEEVLALQTVTHALHELFGRRETSLAWLRNSGLNLTNRLPVVRQLLARAAMG